MEYIITGISSNGLYGWTASCEQQRKKEQLISNVIETMHSSDRISRCTVLKGKATEVYAGGGGWRGNLEKLSGRMAMVEAPSGFQRKLRQQGELRLEFFFYWIGWGMGQADMTHLVLHSWRQITRTWDVYRGRACPGHHESSRKIWKRGKNINFIIKLKEIAYRHNMVEHWNAKLSSWFRGYHFNGRYMHLLHSFYASKLAAKD